MLAAEPQWVHPSSKKPELKAAEPQWIHPSSKSKVPELKAAEPQWIHPTATKPETWQPNGVSEREAPLLA